MHSILFILTTFRERKHFGWLVFKTYKNKKKTNVYGFSIPDPNMTITSARVKQRTSQTQRLERTTELIYAKY